MNVHLAGVSYGNTNPRRRLYFVNAGALTHFVSCAVLGSTNTFWVGNVSIHYYSIHNPLLG